MDASLKQAIAQELEVEPEQLTSDASLDQFERWDSVTALTIMVLLSDAVGTPVKPDEMVKLKRFGDIEALVMAKLAG